MSPLRILSMLLVVALAGCADPGAFLVEEEPGSTDSDPETAPASPSPAAPPSQPSAPASAQPHGEPQYREGAITTAMEQGRGVAYKTIEVSNGIGLADHVALDLDVNYADIVVVPVNKGGYHYDFELKVTADTEESAKTAMEQVSLNHDDVLVATELSLSTAPAFEDPNSLPVSVGGTMRPNLSFTAVLEVPAHLLYAFSLDADYTDIVYDGFAADLLSINADYTDVVARLSETGDISIDADYTDIVVEAGFVTDIELDGSYSEVILRKVDMPDGDIWADLSYGDLNIEFTRAPIMSIEADLSYSDVVVNVPGVDQVDKDEDNPRWESPGYATAAKAVDAGFDLAYSDVVLRA